MPWLALAFELKPLSLSDAEEIRQTTNKLCQQPM